jgi:hypothetical protein
MKRASLLLSNLESCNALSRVLPVCIRSYLKSFLRYMVIKKSLCTLLLLYCNHQVHKDFFYRSVLVLVLYNSSPDILYLIQQGCEDLWLFLGLKRSPRPTILGKTDINFSPVFCLNISDGF